MLFVGLRLGLRLGFDCCDGLGRFGFDPDSIRLLGTESLFGLDSRLSFLSSFLPSLDACGGLGLDLRLGPGSGLRLGLSLLLSLQPGLRFSVEFFFDFRSGLSFGLGILFSLTSLPGLRP